MGNKNKASALALQTPQPHKNKKKQLAVSEVNNKKHKPKHEARSMGSNGSEETEGMQLEFPDPVGNANSIDGTTSGINDGPVPSDGQQLPMPRPSKKAKVIHEHLRDVVITNIELASCIIAETCTTLSIPADDVIITRLIGFIGSIREY
jgi:hypothetical protein